MAQNGSPLKDWSSRQVVDAVNARGLSMSELSEIYTAGRSKSALTRALRSDAYPAHEEYIAAFLGISSAEIWPERGAKRRARAELKAQAKQRAEEIRNQRAA